MARSECIFDDDMCDMPPTTCRQPAIDLAGCTP
ncbi:hypothetical protein BXY51_004015 [Actinoplanes cyaneus]|nr:hypothetical protein [Actinoplanes cyaneus]